MGYVGCVVRVPCSLIGLIWVAQSCCVIDVFRVAWCTFNASVAGSLTQGVSTELINQSIIQTINGSFTFLSNVPSKRSY
jgi:hypothetical protein